LIRQHMKCTSMPVTGCHDASNTVAVMLATPAV
jgi:hypothetical protein